MPGERYTAEQIVAELREAEKLQVYNTFRPHGGLGMMTPAAFAATL